jgi:hypothetical protein
MNGAQQRVEQMLDAGDRLEDIESFIETFSDLPAEGKSALWMLAWAEHDRHGRRQAAGELLAELAHDLG